MPKTSPLSLPFILCALTSIFLLAFGVNANAIPKKVTPKATSEKTAQKTTPEKSKTNPTGSVSVLKDGANIHSGPDAKKEILWKVFKGYPLQVISRQGKWAQVVDFDGDKGWITNDLLAKGKTVIVKATTANLRAGAGKDYETVAEVKHGVVFKPLNTEGDWIKVKHADGTTGWMLNKLLWPN